jgi:uncharacterized protein YdeI (YjbR/CyaY-like superfamily)
VASSPNQTPRFFKTPQAFRAWLERHAASAPDLLVGFRKVGSGQPSMTWSESVDEALCVGWIDGVRKRIDDHSYQIRFSPRREGSIWSAINIAKVEVLTAQGRMRSAGLAAFAKRIERKSRIYAYEQEGMSVLTAEELRQFKRNKGAWSYFAKAPPGYRKQMLYRITNAKRADTRARRLALLIEFSAGGKRL